MKREEALNKARDIKADVVGIYSMVTMRNNSIWFARHLRDSCGLLIAGGPLPSCDPVPFLNDFDVVVRGEGEQTMVELLSTYENGYDPGSVHGIVYRNYGQAKYEQDEIVFTAPRILESGLDKIAFPARDLFQNDMYIDYCKKRGRQATTSVFTTRGCPFNCEFCSNAVFGISYRERSPENVVDEVEQALSFGYDRIHFADDVFTLNKERVFKICDEIRKRGIHFKWECLGRVDSIDEELSISMKDAGCDRIYFGIESGNDSVLKLMNKKTTINRARAAVYAAHKAGLQTGAFFIVCYPGETDDTVLETLHFAVSLPLDYLSFTMPYPLPGTALYERVKGRISKEWEAADSLISDHVLIFNADFSENKMKFAILKGEVRFEMKKRFGDHSLVMKTFELLTDFMFRLLK